MDLLELVNDLSHQVQTYTMEATVTVTSVFHFSLLKAQGKSF